MNVMRSLSLGHNELRRTSDRIETGIRVVVMVAAALALPGAVAIGLLALGHLEAAAAQASATRHAVAARIVDDPRALSVPGRSLPVTTAQVSWAVAGHDVQVGSAVVPATARRGDATTVWVDARGLRTSAPMPRSEAAGLAVLSGASFLVSTLGLLALLLVGTRRLLDRGRHRQWEVAWERFDAARRS